MTVHRIGQRPVEELIVAWLEDALDPVDRTALEAHLSACPDCTGIGAQHRRLGERLGRIPDAAAQRESLDRVRAAAQRPERGPRLRLAVAVLAVALVVAGFIGVRTGVARPAIPERELILERTEVLDGNDLRLVIEDGSAVALRGQSSSVVVQATIRLAEIRPGRAEVRFAVPGEDYGILALAPDTSGVRSLTIEGTIPRPDAPTVYEVWVHLERPDPIDSPRVRVQVHPIPNGERGRLP